ncbi:MAG: hypothetical protein WCJ30_06760, partial [Deltaproteobacteria bacterium]
MTSSGRTIGCAAIMVFLSCSCLPTTPGGTDGASGHDATGDVIVGGDWAAPEILAGGLAQPRQLWVRGDDAIVRLSGGPLLRISIPAGTVTTLGTVGMTTEDLVLDADHAYMTSGGGLYALPLAGGSAVQLGPSHGNLFGVAVDDSYVYWIDSYADVIQRVPKVGGTAETIVTGVTGLTYMVV